MKILDIFLFVIHPCQLGSCIWFFSGARKDNWIPRPLNVTFLFVLEVFSVCSKNCDWLMINTKLFFKSYPVFSTKTLYLPKCHTKRYYFFCILEFSGNCWDLHCCHRFTYKSTITKIKNFTVRVEKKTNVPGSQSLDVIALLPPAKWYQNFSRRKS